MAKLEKWPMEVGDSENVRAVQDELMKVFQPNQPKDKALGRTKLPSGDQMANTVSEIEPLQCANSANQTGIQAICMQRFGLISSTVRVIRGLRERQSQGFWEENPLLG